MRLPDKKYFFAAALFIYQYLVDHFKQIFIGWYWELHQTFSMVKLPVLAEGPIVMVVSFIWHRAFVHGAIIFIVTRDKGFTQLYALVEILAFTLLAAIFLIKMAYGDWLGITFEIAVVLIQLLKSPLFLIIFLPAWFLKKK